MKAKSVGISFENCEYLEIPIEMVKLLIQDGITSTRYIQQGNKTFETKTAKNTYLSIEGNLDTLKLHLDEEDTPSNRIKINDIVSIYINYEDGSEEGCYVKWTGDSDYYNEAQVTTVDGKYITIEIK